MQKFINLLAETSDENRQVTLALLRAEVAMSSATGREHEPNIQMPVTEN